MSNATHLLPGRLRAAAEAMANTWQVLCGDPQVESILDTLPQHQFRQWVELAQAGLDAAEAADPIVPPEPRNPAAVRINLAAAVGLDLGGQAVVLLDVAQDGTVTTSTWTRQAGTPARAIAEWARGLEATAITAVPFQTVFGWTKGGRPTPLTEAERASLPPQHQAHADRNTVDPTALPARPLCAADAESLGRLLGGGSLVILHLDHAGVARGAEWATSARAVTPDPECARRAWRAYATIRRDFPETSAPPQEPSA